ncbi:hypothetical protein EVAR_78334_1 [Eumeta japonica]|uniref:Uncharacterized protein n=1 Tax=Eumeta variegata TaxID=151549 RepID=A0A4C1T4E4_EUMVA|nr:hypothetical protein EVAR_78334_1 [Eumeta japonica]
MERMIGDDEAWQVVRTFCEKTKSQKEAAERKRVDSALLVTGHRRAWRRRNAFTVRGKKLRTNRPVVGRQLSDGGDGDDGTSGERNESGDFCRVPEVLYRYNPHKPPRIFASRKLGLSKAARPEIIRGPASAVAAVTIIIPNLQYGTLVQKVRLVLHPPYSPHYHYSGVNECRLL